MAFWPRIYAEEGFCKFGMSRFFNEEIRRANAKHDDRQGGDGQLLLWPEAYRTLIKRIDRSEVFVPSRDEWVALEPDVISKAEIAEAGQYLRKQGHETVRRGDWMVALADMLPDDGQVAA